jgi:hypothetical protein
MGRIGTKRFGTLPNANGTITRLAYARAKANGIDPRALLKKTNITLQQINNASLRLSVRDQIGFLNLVASALQDDYLGFHLAELPDIRELGFLYYVSASSEILSEARSLVSPAGGVRFAPASKMPSCHCYRMATPHSTQSHVSSA